jgi:GNAT superfamily N-acetyltransferase
MQFTVFYLEMFQPPERIVPPPRDGLTVVQARRPTLHFYRYLYDAVGRDWNWTRRKIWSDDELAAVIQHPQNEVHVFYADGVPAGFAEIDFRDPADVELVQFGLVPEFIGQGLGTYFLQWALDYVWSRRPNRFWLHTCTMDHPRALSNYLNAGFTICREETRTR